MRAELSALKEKRTPAYEDILDEVALKVRIDETLGFLRQLKTPKPYSDPQQVRDHDFVWFRTTKGWTLGVTSIVSYDKNMVVVAYKGDKIWDFKATSWKTLLFAGEAPYDILRKAA